MIDPRQIAEHWFLVLTFIFAVVFGKIFSVTLGCLLWGRSLQTSLKCGMSLAQIGEFSFIIASVGIATKATDAYCTPCRCGIGITTLLTPWLIRASDRTAAFVDRKLPRRIQTFLGLYGSWIAKLGESPTDPRRVRIRRFVRWLAVDTAILP